ncbi:MAG: lamin tail domain-containing protein [Paludibacter sp.]|nr:lamin tail domain-containing protein [Paludibacter sp.]
MKKLLSTRFVGIITVILLLVQLHSYSQTLRINEFMAQNESSLTDEDGAFSDWIEIYNPTATFINLDGWALTDDIALPFKWKFPATTIAPGNYLVVFASSKDRAIAGHELHTNFSLKATGEYLALVQPTGIATTEFNPVFPAQQSNYSYGYYKDTYTVFSDPTPGKDNMLSAGRIIPAPVFSQKHGIYESPFQLSITSTIANALIYYTTDGSVPSNTNGTLYTSAIPISTTSIIRAVAYVGGEAPGKTSTQSYLFLNDVLKQSNTPAGYPSAWGPYTAIAGNAIADYEMDPELMKDATFAANVKKTLAETPTISLVTDKANFFSPTIDPNTGGIYIYTGAPITNTTYDTGRDWERPVSFEYMAKDTSFQIDCGIRLQGGHGRRPEKSPKHSFLLVFDSKYGPSKLNYPLLDKNGTQTFENLILRAGFGNTWVHQDGAARAKATYQEDIWTKDTQRAMGHPGSNSIYAHLYINGMYWGMYAPSERMDKEFAASHMGGNEDDYDVIKDYAEVSDGNILAWNSMMSMANAGLETTEKYQLIQGKNPDGPPNYNAESLVDVVNLADYMLLNFYGGNTDWDHHNWSAMRNRLNPGKGFKFMCWDAEIMFTTLTGNVLAENNDNCPSRVYQQLLKNADFKHLLADRIQRHCFNDGVLTPDSVIARWLKRKAQVENPIYAESARWGDYRRDVHIYQVAPYALYTKEGYWTPQQNFLLNTYFPQRTSVFVSQLRTAGLFPSIDAPVFSINGKNAFQHIVSGTDKLTMTATKGTMYYTTNGTDPVDWKTGTVSKSAILYSQAIPLIQSSHIVARTFYNNEWSASNSRYYVVPANYSDIKITEIQYHPLGENLIDDSGFEFIELKNTGTSCLDMGGLKFTQGIDYTFPAETQLGAGEFIVLASNSNNFFSRYKFRPVAEYNGKLDNGGEQLVLISPTNDVVSNISYATSGIWPSSPDGTGYSLVPTDYNPKGNQTDGVTWRASYKVGGSPGTDDVPLTALSAIQIHASNGVELSQNYPNPVNQNTYIDYEIPENAFIELSIYNLVGQKISTLVHSNQFAGLNQTSWNGCDQNNNPVPNGIYFYRINVRIGNNQQTITRKMLLSH